MRKIATKNGITAKAYAGTTGIIVAMNVKDEQREGLLGFAIERLDGQTGQKEFLLGTLHFPNSGRRAGDLAPTSESPIQKFRWSDYRVHPATNYEYTVHPVYGRPGALEVKAGPTVRVKTAGLDGEHSVIFNRAAAASQAFSRKFPGLDAEIDRARREGRLDQFELPPEALAWLSRGLLEQITGIIEQARDETWALDIAIYEYELPAIVRAVNAARNRGVNLRIIFHAKEGDPQTEENEHNLRAVPQRMKRARLTSRIFHQKFIVLSRMRAGARSPEAVLCGSTNFTHNGVYRQANVMHIVRRADAARRYLNLFEAIFAGANPSATRRFINEQNPFQNSEPLFAGFSPRSGLVDLTAFVNEINQARRDVLFCTAFDLFDGIEAALLGQPNDEVLRYGVQNTRSRITGTHADRTARFTATAMLNRGLEGFLKESTKGQRGNILIHTKLVVVNFTSNQPVIISGSHNLSKAASESNDENYLILRGNTDVADIYGCELMRLYDHYRFRFRQRESNGQGEPPALTADDRWTDRYFRGGSLSMSDRLRFAGVTA